MRGSNMVDGAMSRGLGGRDGRRKDVEQGFSSYPSGSHGL